MADNKENAINTEKTNKRVTKKSKGSVKNIILIVVYTIITALIVGICMFFIHFLKSDKKELRAQAIEAYQNENYDLAAGLFEAALAEEQWFSKALDSDINLYLADTYIMLGRFNEAVGILKYLEDNKLVDHNIIMSKENLLYGFISYNEKNYDSALKYFKAEEDKSDIKIKLYIASCYMELGDNENMIAQYEEYLQVRPMNTLIAYQLSTYYFANNDISSGKSYLDMGLACQDTYYTEYLKYNEIVYYEKINNLETAYQKAALFISEYPENEDGIREYDFLYSRLNINEVPVHIEEE